MRDFIPQIEPWIDELELVQLKRVVDNTYVTEHQEFEGLIRDLTGSSYAVSMSNGTVALFCCLKALGIGPGDEVIVPNMTFIASSNSVLMAGATPVLCDINKTNLCIDQQKCEELITKKTKAIMPVHIYGQSCDMHNLISLSTKYGIPILEDAAQGVGVRFCGKHAGTFGELGVLSFYGNKTITCGEGGVILTDSKELRDKCYQLKNHGRLKKGTFTHNSIGYNFCFTEMQAAIGISQMHKLDRIISRKKQIYERYQAELKPVGSFLEKINVDRNCSPVWWFTSFLTHNKLELMSHLSKMGIQTREFFYPLNKQPCYKHSDFADRNLPVSNEVFDMGISLPSAYCLTDEEQTYIINTINEYFTGS